MRIGEITLRPVIEIDSFEVPPSLFIRDITETDLAPHLESLCPTYMAPETHQCRASQHAWLIEAAGKRILVDPCVGSGRERAFMSFYHMLDSPLLKNLEKLGVKPEDIDYVFCTHLHFDHVGWNTRLQDGRYVPTFPNARYLLPAKENEYWKRDLENLLPPDQDFNHTVYAECVQPVIEAGLAELVEAGIRIADCLTLIAAEGHTLGHMAGVLESKGEGAVLAGDALHHPIQILFPDKHIHADDVEEARRTRHQLLGLCAEKNYWLAPAHFRAPHVCKIRKTPEGYKIEWREHSAAEA